jgi:hypothetical protein
LSNLRYGATSTGILPRVDQEPGGSQADPPGVLTQVTGPPELDTATEPSAPQGIPTAGRVSTLVVDVVVGVGDFDTVVCGAVEV